jgi:hypothetical protein
MNSIIAKSGEDLERGDIVQICNGKIFKVKMEDTPMNTEDINKVLKRLDGDIAALRLMVGTKTSIKSDLPVRGISWSTFERELVADKLADAVDECIFKTDRTRLSIKWEMYRQLREKLIGR